jgi:hypothetical protein
MGKNWIEILRKFSDIEELLDDKNHDYFFNIIKDIFEYINEESRLNFGSSLDRDEKKMVIQNGMKLLLYDNECSKKFLKYSKKEYSKITNKLSITNPVHVFFYQIVIDPETSTKYNNHYIVGKSSFEDNPYAAGKSSKEDKPYIVGKSLLDDNRGEHYKINKTNPFVAVINNYKSIHAQFMIELLSDAIYDNCLEQSIDDKEYVKKINDYFLFADENPLMSIIKYNLYKWIDYFMIIKRDMRLINNIDLLYEKINIGNNIVNYEISVLVYDQILTCRQNMASRKIISKITEKMSMKEYVKSIIIVFFFMIFNNIKNILSALF